MTVMVKYMYPIYAEVDLVEGAVVRVARELVVGLELEHLLVRDPGELGMRVADVRVPQARRAVEEATAVDGVHVGALAALDHELPADDGWRVRLRRPQGGGVEDAQQIPLPERVERVGPVREVGMVCAALLPALAPLALHGARVVAASLAGGYRGGRIGHRKSVCGKDLPSAM